MSMYIECLDSNHLREECIFDVWVDAVDVCARFGGHHIWCRVARWRCIRPFFSRRAICCRCQ